MSLMSTLRIGCTYGSVRQAMEETVSASFDSCFGDQLDPCCMSSYVTSLAANTAQYKSVNLSGTLIFL